MHNYKNRATLLFAVVTLLFFGSAYTQVERAIDNKGTIKEVRNTRVHIGIDNKPADADAVIGDIYFDKYNMNKNPKEYPNIMQVWSGTQWIEFPFWGLSGNKETTKDNFLGTTDDVKLQLRSNNKTIAELGRRQTLGLTAMVKGYSDENQYVMHLKGGGKNNSNSGTSALQFATPYKGKTHFYNHPIIYTTDNASFRIQASGGHSDNAEIGTAGPVDKGRLEFAVGDNGNEPIVFKRYEWKGGTDGKGRYRELFRVQGHNEHESVEQKHTRFGININPKFVNETGDLDRDYNAEPFRMANSTFEVNGSVSKSIDEVTGTGDFSVTELHRTLIVRADRKIIFPEPSLSKGRIYVIKNLSGKTISTSGYINKAGGTIEYKIPDGATIKIQSNKRKSDDYSYWQLISETPGILQPKIIAVGEVAANGTCVCSGADARYTDAGNNAGYYWINNFKAPGEGKYIIQLTLKALPAGQWDRQIYYYDKDVNYNSDENNFKVKITDNLGGVGGGAGNKRKKSDFSFVIISNPNAPSP